MCSSDLPYPGINPDQAAKHSIENLGLVAQYNLMANERLGSLAGRRVLVTGAGGSIGSELCRQIAASGCAQLVLIDAAEANLFHIDREIGEALAVHALAVFLPDLGLRERLIALGLKEPEGTP